MLRSEVIDRVHLCCCSGLLVPHCHPEHPLLRAKKMPVSVSSMRRRTTSRVRSGSNMRLIAPSEAFTRLGEGEESCASGDGWTSLLYMGMGARV